MVTFRSKKSLTTRVYYSANAVGALREPVLENKELSKEAKVIVCNTVVVPTLVYGCEVWVLKERDKIRLQVMEMKV